MAPELISSAQTNPLKTGTPVNPNGSVIVYSPITDSCGFEESLTTTL